MNLRYSIDPADTDGGTTAGLIEQEATDDFAIPEPDPFIFAARVEAEKRIGGSSDFASDMRVQLYGMAEWAREFLAAQGPKAIPGESEMEVVGDWLVVRNVQEPEYPAGPEYGPYPYSDAAPLVHLAQVAGFPPEPPELTDAEVEAAARVLLADYQADYDGGHLEEFKDLARAALTAARVARTQS